MNDVLIYPYDSGIKDMIHYKKFISAFKNIYLCSPNGWGYTGNKVVVEDVDGQIRELVISDDFNACMDKSDTVIFVECDHSIDKINMIYPRVELAAKNRKKIIDMITEPSQRKKLKEKVIQLGGEIVFFGAEINEEETKGIPEDMKGRGLADFEVPVIVVGGIVENCGKYAVQLGLKESLEDKGYNVLLVGSKQCSKFLGAVNFPIHIFQSELNDVDQVFAMNRYLKKMEARSPDVIIVGIPGGMLGCNKKLYGDFGILAYKTFTAIRADYFVICLPYANYNDNYFESMETYVLNRFSCNIDAFSVYDQRIDWDKIYSIKPKTIPFASVSQDIVNNTFNSQEITDLILSKIWTNTKQDIEQLANNIINSLGVDEPEIVF